MINLIIHLTFSYSNFLDTRIQYPPYPWLLHSHRRLSNEILYARKRVAVLRHELLSAFKLTNSIDKRLIRNEYVNWLLDEKAKCNKAKWMLLKDEVINRENNIISSSRGEDPKGSKFSNGGEVKDDNNKSNNNEEAYNNSQNERYEEKMGEYMRKYQIELKDIIRYCGNVKKQLDIFAF